MATVSTVSAETSDTVRSYGRAAGLLTLALGGAGILAYLFFALASHHLSEENYGRIVVLWSIVFLTISILLRPVEQLLARNVAELREHGESPAQAIRVAAFIQLALCGGFVAGALAFRTTLTDELFDGDDLYFWSLVVAFLAFGASYFAKGFFAGSRQMSWYAAVLLVEGVARLGLALIAAIGIGKGFELFAFAVALAPIASLAVVPLALARPQEGPSAGQPEVGRLLVAPGTDPTPELRFARGGGFAAAVLLIMLSEQILLNSGVLFVRTTESAAAAGFIFNVLMVARAPVVLFQAVAASLLPHLTRLRSRGDPTSAKAFDNSVGLTLMMVAGFASITALILLAVGPAAMQLAFGDNFEYDRAGLVTVAIGMGFYLSAATLNQAALAYGAARSAAVCWLLSSGLFVVINLSSASGAFRRVEVGFAVSAGLLCVCLYVLYRRCALERHERAAPDSA